MLYPLLANNLLPLETPAPGTGIDPDKVQPGLLGFAFFVVLATVLVLLVMSMRRHLQRIDVGRHQQDKLAKAAATAAADGRAAAAAAAASGGPSASSASSAPSGPEASAPPSEQPEGDGGAPRTG